MSKYNTDLDYVILDIDISKEELKEIMAEADKIISENKESKENLAVAYLKKAQCLRMLINSISPEREKLIKERAAEAASWLYKHLRSDEETVQKSGQEDKQIKEETTNKDVKTFNLNSYNLTYGKAGHKKMISDVAEYILKDDD